LDKKRSDDVYDLRIDDDNEDGFLCSDTSQSLPNRRGYPHDVLIYDNCFKIIKTL